MKTPDTTTSSLNEIMVRRPSRSNVESVMENCVASTGTKTFHTTQNFDIATSSHFLGYFPVITIPLYRLVFSWASHRINPIPVCGQVLEGARNCSEIRAYDRQGTNEAQSGNPPTSLQTYRGRNAMSARVNSA